MSKKLETLLEKYQGNCWEWSGHKSLRGYGLITRRGKQLQAHRFSYRAFCGKIPAGLNVLHRCDNPLCVNPAHLYVGTQAQNISDKVARGRCARGSRIRQAVLSEADIPFVRQLYENGCTQVQIAKKFGVRQTTISAVLRGETWRHV